MPKLTLQRLRAARRTLRLAAHTPGFPGATGATDPQATFIEAMRNLAAFAHWTYGEAGLTAVLDDDA